MGDWKTAEDVERDPIIKRLAVVARDNAAARVCFDGWRAGLLSREDALVTCCELLAGDNARLFDMATRATEASPPPVVITIGGEKLVVRDPRDLVNTKERGDG